MKRQLALVTVDNDIIRALLKMPQILTKVKYADMLYVYGFCDGSATAAVEEYRRRFPMRRIPDCRAFNTLRERRKLRSAHVLPEPARQQHMGKKENILEMVQRSPTTDTSRCFTNTCE
jgi:hypothetical protein